MGLTFTEVYNMPVYLRRYYYTKLADYIKRQREAEQESAKTPTTNRSAGPPKVR